MKKKRNAKLIYLAVLLLAAAAAVVFFLNKDTIVIDLKGNETIHVEYGSGLPEADVKAYKTGTLLRFQKKEIEVKTESDVKLNEPGTYTIRYTAEANGIKEEKTQTVIVEDTTPPVITLKTDPEHYTPFNHPYEEEGFTAEDVRDGDLSASVVSEEKDGVVYYTVTDSSGNTAKAERTIVYDDRTPPVLTLDGGAQVFVYNGDPFEDKFTAVDDCDGDVTGKVTVSGQADTNTNGSYTLTYTVTDAHENTATAERTVVVRARSLESEIKDFSKVIYLTFDDGPGRYTNQLLDILKKYDVKATFFVTAQFPRYLPVITREDAEGHTVAVHTFSHRWKDVYSSPEIYWADFDKMNDQIEKYTGKRSNIFRFPGGSANTVSKKYCKGVVTAVAQQAAQKGYVYYDWNIISGDSGNTEDTNQIYRTVITHIASNTAKGQPSCVLQHDIKDYSVAAVEGIIQWGLQHGYTFLPLSENSPTMHRTIAN